MWGQSCIHLLAMEGQRVRGNKTAPRWQKDLKSERKASPFATKLLREVDCSVG